MTRGKQKEQARERAQKLADKNKGGKSQIGARAAGLKISCPTCKAPVANYKLLQVHMEAKHPKDTIPPESSFTT
ncbi:putative zinc finger protein [Thamnocephalis sphaerospora]|uniref:Putative zinc finger protein n=1 Tax=Thamnocephalis sphaerospora TaxID=78915 RepID=A0A4P9XMA7_9FUNG|nr:putative zinc finger protein [Thamnocephalis sphaerospora]|eukprot:RKP07047.1 putative zinc finger protein [Thamnocephalis sphaerospora]